MDWAKEEPDKGAAYIKLLDAADCILVNTEFVGQQIKELGYKGAYHIVGDPINVNEAIADAFSTVPTTVKHWTFLSYGRLEDPTKRFMLATDAVSNVNEKYKTNFLYQAAGPAVSAGQRFNSAYGTGFLEKNTLTTILCQTKCVLAPSIREGLGLIPIEAVICGAIPVVADIPVMQEVWGNTIPMFTADDIESFVEVLSKLIDSGFQWDLGPAREIAANYTPERVVDRILMALEQN